MIDEHGEVHEPDVVVGSALESLNRSEIDMQITTAKRYPRSIKEFRDKATEMATLDEETAASMFYVLPRGGKSIEGPSVRLAEIVCGAWKNLRVETRTIDVGAEFVTLQGACMDLENNVGVKVEVQRRITDKNGRRFNSDMIGVTCNAGASIALRNAVFRVVPRVYVNQIYEKARAASIGKSMTMGQRRTKAFDLYAKLGVSKEQILSLLNKPGEDDIDEEDLILLRGTFTAIKDGETTVDEIFGGTADDQTDGAMSALKKKIAARREEARAAASKEESAPKTEDPPAPADEPMRESQSAREPGQEPAPADPQEEMPIDNGSETAKARRAMMGAVNRERIPAEKRDGVSQVELSPELLKVLGSESAAPMWVPIGELSIDEMQKITSALKGAK